MPKKIVLKGTPNEWWEKAEKLTVAETISRQLGCWYISRKSQSETTNSFHIMTPTLAAVETGKKSLARERKKFREQDRYGFAVPVEDPDNTMSENVRMFIRQELEKPEWAEDNLLLADLPDAEEEGRRELWRRASNGWWTLVMDARVRVTNERLAYLNPKRISIQER